jgi:hypothetical protein
VAAVAPATLSGGPGDEIGRVSGTPPEGLVVDVRSRPSFLKGWIASQAMNGARHAAALRTFSPGEFGEDAASPTEAHRLAANELIAALHAELRRVTRGLRATAVQAVRRPEPVRLEVFVTRKEEAQGLVEAVEKVWHFYFELFNQRQTSIAKYLVASDRIALDCYQAVYTNLGRARSIPSPPPFSYMEGGFGPATFRRNVLLTKLGRQSNPFPLVKLPYHRLVNPWTLGAIPHEVAHNIQSDLELWTVLPRRIFRALRTMGIPLDVAITWSRWHKEMFADLLGVLLIGPSFVSSLMDVVAKSPDATAAFNPRGVHPTPYIRVFINLELLGRMDFPDETDAMRRAWRRLYSAGPRGLIPQRMLDTFAKAVHAVVDAMCFQPYDQLGGKAFAEVVLFSERHQAMVNEAAHRLAAGVDPGILPERFLIAAARCAHDRRLAPANAIADNFYQALGRR